MFYSQIVPTVPTQVPLSQSYIPIQTQIQTVPQPVLTGSYIQPQMQIPLQQSFILSQPVIPQTQAPVMAPSTNVPIIPYERFIPPTPASKVEQPKIYQFYQYVPAQQQYVTTPVQQTINMPVITEPAITVPMSYETPIQTVQMPLQLAAGPIQMPSSSVPIYNTSTIPVYQ